MSAPLNAFCLMPDNNAAHLDFMTGVLGLRVKRAEESFLAFDTSGVVVCLWESGHVCGQLGYRTNTVADCAATAILTLEMPGETAVTQAVAAARLMGLATLVEAGGVLLRDRASTWWRLRAGAGHAVRAVELLVEDVDVTTRFLAGMGFAAAAGGFAAGNGVAISVRGRADFAPEAPWLGRRPNGPIAMPAIGCATLGEVNARVAEIAAHGIGIDVAARMHPWGFRAAYLTDPSHNVWEIYTTERTDV